MARLSMWMMTLALVIGLSGHVLAQPTPILVSGQSIIGLIDGDDDGPDGNDCAFSASLLGSALSITAVQDTNFLMRACSGGYTGTGYLGDDSSSNFVSALITGSTISPPASGVPFAITAFQEVPEPNGEPPISVSKKIDGIETSEDGSTTAAVQLCSTGGQVTARIALANGTILFRNGAIVPGTPAYLQLPSLPVEEASPNLGSFVLRNGYIPVTPDGTITAAVMGQDPFLILDLARLQSCSSRIAAPMASNWGLALMMLALLVITAWRLSRSPAYSSLLPRD